MTEPSVLIVAKCPNGHETQMFPEKCMSLHFTSHIGIGEETIRFVWDCPVCPRDNYKHMVEVCPTL